MSECVLVLSATGNVGVPLVNLLTERKLTVKAASRSGKAIYGAEGIVFDFTDKSSYAPAFAEVNTVYLMLPTGFPNSTETFKRVIDYAASREVKVVLQTAIEASFDPTSPYVSVEEYLKRTNKKYVVLRPTWFMDNFHIFWAHDIKRGKMSLPAGTGKTSFISIQDVAESAASAISSNQFNGQTFNLTGIEAFSYQEAMNVFSSVLGRSIEFASISNQQYIEELVASGMPRANAEGFAQAMIEAQSGALDIIYSDVQTLTGKPARTLKQYIEQNRNHFIG